MNTLEIALRPMARTERAFWLGLNLAIGVGVTLAIFLVLAAVQHQRFAMPPGALDELEAVALPVQPPPPPERPADTVPALDIATIQLAAAPSPGSAVKIPAAPLTAEIVPTVQVIPRFDFSAALAKPNTQPVEHDEQRVFSRAEVDQRPVAIVRQSPQVTPAQIRAMKALRASFLMVAGVDGTVSNITLVESTGDDDVDRACVAALQQWKFKPAVRKGREVRCWVHQNIVFRVSGATPFEVGSR